MSSPPDHDHDPRDQIRSPESGAESTEPRRPGSRSPFRRRRSGRRPEGQDQRHGAGAPPAFGVDGAGIEGPGVLEGSVEHEGQASHEGLAVQEGQPGGFDAGAEFAPGGPPGRRRGRGPRTPRPDLEVPEEERIPSWPVQAAVGLDAGDPRRRLPRHIRPLPDDDSPKLHKVLAESGIGSRRDMEELILAGRVSVNGEPAHVGQRIGPMDLIRINGRPLRRKPTGSVPRVLLYHKPAGEVVTREDPEHRPLVFERLPKPRGGRWVAVGRLDLNTEGLLIFTTSGDIANRLMHPRYGWEREYAVRILGRVDEGARQKLLNGVELEDGPAAFSVVSEIGGTGANCWYRVVISEGRNREVRRLFDAVGLTVSRLVRVRFGPVALPTRLRRGRWLELEGAEVLALQTAMRESDAALRAAGVDLEPETFRDSSLNQSDREDWDDHDEDELMDDNIGNRLDPAEAKAIAARHAGEEEVAIDDDDWQPRSNDAHQEAISRAIRKTGGEGRRAAFRARALAQKTQARTGFDAASLTMTGGHFPAGGSGGGYPGTAAYPGGRPDGRSDGRSGRQGARPGGQSGGRSGGQPGGYPGGPAGERGPRHGGPGRPNNPRRKGPGYGGPGGPGGPNVQGVQGVQGGPSSFAGEHGGHPEWETVGPQPVPGQEGRGPNPDGRGRPGGRGRNSGRGPNPGRGPRGPGNRERQPGEFQAQGFPGPSGVPRPPRRARPPGPPREPVLARDPDAPRSAQSPRPPRTPRPPRPPGPPRAPREPRFPRDEGPMMAAKPATSAVKVEIRTKRRRLPETPPE